MEREMREEIERMRRSFRAELVPYAAAGSGARPDGPGRRCRSRSRTTLGMRT